MKKIFGYMTVMVCLACISSFTGKAAGQEAETVITGKIIEISEEQHMIQIKNRNYVVIAVFVDDGVSEEPEPGFFRDLKLGSIVELHLAGKNKNSRQAKKVILFTGDKEKEKLKNLE